MAVTLWACNNISTHWRGCARYVVCPRLCCRLLDHAKAPHRTAATAYHTAPRLLRLCTHYRTGYATAAGVAAWFRRGGCGRSLPPTLPVWVTHAFAHAHTHTRHSHRTLHAHTHIPHAHAHAKKKKKKKRRSLDVLDVVNVTWASILIPFMAILLGIYYYIASCVVKQYSVSFRSAILSVSLSFFHCMNKLPPRCLPHHLHHLYPAD